MFSLVSTIAFKNSAFVSLLLKVSEINLKHSLELEKIISKINDVMEYNNKESYTKEQIIKVVEFAIDNVNNSRYKLMIKDIGV